MAHDGVYSYGRYVNSIQDVLQDNKLRSATIVSNIHEVEFKTINVLIIKQCNSEEECIKKMRDSEEMGRPFVS